MFLKSNFMTVEIYSRIKKKANYILYQQYTAEKLLAFTYCSEKEVLL